MNKFWQTAIRLGKYASSSLVGTAVDMLVLWLCSDFWLHDYVGEYLISPCISFEAAVITNYLVAHFFVWRDRVSASPFASILRRFLRYNASCVLAFTVRLSISLLFQHWFQWDVVLCNLVALLFSGGLNFLLQHFWVFSKKRHNINRMY